MENNNITPSINNFTEYSFIGKNSFLKPKYLFLLLLGLVIVWSSIKHIPPYLTENSLIKKEKEDFEIFYNYIYLIQFENSKNTNVEKLLKKINQKDSVFLNEYNLLKKKHLNEIRKAKLKKELKLLEKDDR